MTERIPRHRPWKACRSCPDPAGETSGTGLKDGLSAVNTNVRHVQLGLGDDIEISSEFVHRRAQGSVSGRSCLCCGVHKLTERCLWTLLTMFVDH
jgi:hypothetical protein